MTAGEGEGGTGEVGGGRSDRRVVGVGRSDGRDGMEGMTGE